MSAFADLESLPVLDVWADAVRARRVEGERLTLAVLELTAGAVVPEHHHPQEQIGVCVQGSLRFRVGFEVRELHAGGTWRIAPDVPHEAVAGPDGAVAIEVFSPIRSDWDFPELEPIPPRWPG